MSSRRSYSKESRSYYSRSSSYENKSSNSSHRNRPLSSRLIERDFSSPSLTFDHPFDDPFFFERRSRKFLDDFDRRLRGRFNDDLFDEEFFRRNSLDVQRNIPINTRQYNTTSSITRDIPIQYTLPSTNRHERVYKQIDYNDNWSSNSFNNEAFRARENRISTDDWPPKQGIQYSNVANPPRTMSTQSYSSTSTTNYF